MKEKSEEWFDHPLFWIISSILIVIFSYYGYTRGHEDGWSAGYGAGYEQAEIEMQRWVDVQ